jgi:hypothetical protein
VTVSDEARMSNDEGMTKPERQRGAPRNVSVFVIRICFVIRHLDFVIEMVFRPHPA